MANLSPFVKRFTPTRFIEGSLGEAEQLLGGHLPALPPGERSEGEEVVYYVQLHPRLRELAQGYLTSLFLELCPEAGRAVAGPGRGSVEKDYASLLQRTLVNTLLYDRRIGLLNLFWLSHSKEIAETIAKLTGRTPLLRRARFAIHPLLASFLRNAWQAASREVEQSRPGLLRFVLGPYITSSLVDLLIEDQLPLVLTEIGEVDFAALLTNNTRYRISPEIFSEIHDLLYRELGERMARRDPLLLARVGRQLPSLERDSYALPAQLTKMLFNGAVRRHLLSDSWRIGAKLVASARIRAEADRGVDPLGLLDTFDELASAVQRFEIFSHVRDHIRLLSSHMTEDQIHEQYGPVRLYRFSESVEVTGNAVNATVMFLDLRGFTKTSEGMVSERDLTRELYTVFDDFTEIINRFGGEVDKYLGDGMMVTFGATHASRYGALNAVRTAVLLQEKIQQMRQEGKTQFSMGVSIHHGRVYLAHFIGSSGAPDTTVIGRNVNVAGRLSSASKRETDEVDLAGGMVDSLFGRAQQEADETPPPSSSGLQVEIDREGTLYNQGIAISRETLHAVESVVPLTYLDGVEGLQAEFYDPSINKKLLLRYVGDAKFKGVRSSFPVYSVDYRG